MKVFIAGGSGFIGRHLTAHLLQSGHEPVILSRNPEEVQKQFSYRINILYWDGKSPDQLKDQFIDDYAVINLAGENISGGRWTQTKKNRILQSRLLAVKSLIETILIGNTPPKVFIQGSAIGYYSNISDEISDENSSKGYGFLSDVVTQTEEALFPLSATSTRLIVIRTGIVLGKNGGALPKLIAPYRFYAGGPLGNGMQWQSWIHIEDECAAILHLLNNKSSSGIYNLTAPNPVRMKELSAAISKVSGKPAWLPVPGIALKMAFGEMAESILLKGERVVPARLLKENFTFKYPDIVSALSELLK